MASHAPSWGAEAWLELVGADPRQWVLDSEEPYARWVALTGLQDRDPASLARSASPAHGADSAGSVDSAEAVDSADPEVVAAHRATLDDPAVQGLIEGLPDWDLPVKSHGAPTYPPNLLHLLADLGVTAADDPAVARLTDQLLEHTTDSGRFQSYATFIRLPEPEWGSVVCDHYAVTEALVRHGRGDEPAVVRALEVMGQDLVETSMGAGCLCLPHSVTHGRGPGRKGDPCPQVTLESLRTFARLPADRRPDGLPDVARTVLRLWRERDLAKPYMFGHGVHFKTVKWPNVWYSVLWVLDALAGYPQVWSGPEADPLDRRAAAELVAALVAYNVGPEGRVTPQSCYRGFADFSFGRKSEPSPIATAWVCRVLRRYDAVVEIAREIDVTVLSSSKGGTGVPVPPTWSRLGWTTPPG